MTDEYYKSPIEEKTLKEKVDLLIKEKESEKNKLYKEKNFRVPFMSRVGKGAMKKGFATIVTMYDNRNIGFTKKKIIGGTIKLEDDPISIHAINPKDIFFYKGKPFIFQPKKRLNPYNPVTTNDDPIEKENETYGQKYVMARMEGDKINLKKSMGNWGLWLAGLAILAIIGYVIFGGAA